MWYAAYWGVLSGAAWAFNGVYNNFLSFGLPVANADPYTPILTTSEMLALDKKIDDGKPGTGILVSILRPCVVKADGVTTATSADTNTAIYNLSATGKQCSLYFPKVF